MVEDNFNDNSIDTSIWTTSTPMGSITETGGQLQITAPGYADWWSGGTEDSPIIYTALPGGNFEVKIKITTSTLNTNTLRGLHLYKDRDNALMFALANISGNNVIRVDKIVSDSGSILTSVTGPVSPNPTYLKITSSSSGYSFDYSTDDNTYITVYTTSSLGFVPTDVGLFSRTGAGDSTTDTFDDFTLNNQEIIKALITVNSEDYSDWLWQNEIEITGSVDGQLTDYPVNITIPYDSEFMRYDFLDIRFGTDYGLNLPYFVRRQVDGDYAEFIVKIPVIPASPDSVIIYAYAGNDQASDQSDGFSVFSLFDDFNEDYTVGIDTSKWTADTPCAITDGILNIHADLPLNHTRFASKTSYGENYILGMRAKAGAVPGASSYISFGFDDNSTRYMKEYIDNTSSKFFVNDASSEDTGSDHDGTYTPTTYYVYEIEHKSGLDITENINFTPVETSPVSITTAVPVRFHVYAYGAAADLYVDYVYVRKSIGNEPSIGALGTWSTTTHSDIYQATLWVPYTHDSQALVCIRPLREDFQVLLNILGYDEKDIQFLLNIAEDKNYNYIKFVQALVEVTDDAWYLDSQALISIGNVTTGTLEVKGKILYHPNSNATIIEGLSPSADDKAQFVMKIGGRIYG